MRFIINESNDPYFNLALDEYALKSIDVDEDYFILWQNQPSVIIGKNQNTLAEINPAFIEEKGIKVARRVSGGGAVYHDFGNLNFTFISNVEDISKVNFHKYVDPMIQALKSLGINAVASGRNDILIDGLKISGNAQRQSNGRLMHHGTLLFDVNIEDMVRSLNVSDEKFISKAAKSVRSRVTNIKQYLPEGTTIQDFKDRLHYFLSNNLQDQEIVLSEAQLDEIKQAANERFSTWEWIYGESPAFSFKNKERFAGGTLEILMQVENGYIKNIRFMGDFLGIHDVQEIEDALINQRILKQDIQNILKQFELSFYFGEITQDEIMSLMHL